METFIKEIKPKTILLWLFIGTLALFTLTGTVSNAEKIKVFFFDLYNNRLIAERYAYKLNTTFSKKKTILLDADFNKKNAFDAFRHDSVRHLLAEFLKTKLSKEEAGVFKSLKTNIEYTEKLELTLIDKPDSHKYLIADCDHVLKDLNALSIIKIKEGERLLNESF